MNQASRMSSLSTSAFHRQTHSESEDAGSGHDICGASVTGFLSRASYSEKVRIDNNTAECSGTPNPHGGGFIDTTALGQQCCFISQNKAPLRNITPTQQPMYGAPQTTDTLSNGCVGVSFGVQGKYFLPDAHPQSFTGDGKTQLQVDVEDAVTSTNPSGMHTVNDSNHFGMPPDFHKDSRFRGNIATIGRVHHRIEVSYDPKNSLETGGQSLGHGNLDKLDSFGRWMHKEIGKDCDQSFMPSVPGTYWNSVDSQSAEKEVSSLSSHAHLDIGPLGPSLSQEQLFHIHDFSPDWAYSGTESKVLIVGDFLSVEPRSRKWCCMFGEDEVPAEVLSPHIIRCQAPARSPGRVPFYITCCNRLACSQVREFEYLPGRTSAQDEIYYQIRFAKVLSLGIERKRLTCSGSYCLKCNLGKDLSEMLIDNESEWGKIEKASETLQGSNRILKEALIQSMLKEKLFKWLVCKVHEGGKGPSVWDEEGLGVIHLASALGYQWAIRPIVSAGVNPNLRDACGRTALQWAAHYGRDETCLALLELGAAPATVESPTLQSPELI
ncbi:putative calmodulin-binding transcription activator 3 isoform X1 [Iris pallida]|uniref:Calmodulin-binding transcription activator 3 isoform X1 n=1 Tax=Iris pallida TaxID=29817 RepID=A0AAX6I2Q8_IRIPA|nr:putative calmodulin-binding transcription activator 3 isoform X1 [Iris pallida]